MTLDKLAEEIGIRKQTISILFDNAYMTKYKKGGRIYVLDNQADAIRGYYILKNKWKDSLKTQEKEETLSWDSLKWSNGYGDYIPDIASKLLLTEDFICNLLDNLMINYWQDMYLSKEKRNLLIGYFYEKRDFFNYQYGVISEAYKNANDILYNTLLSLNGLS